MKGALLEVSDASFDLKIADCVWERDLNNLTVFVKQGFLGVCVWIFGVWKRTKKLMLFDF